jgi:hypothetical protein
MENSLSSACNDGGLNNQIAAQLHIAETIGGLLHFQ